MIRGSTPLVCGACRRIARHLVSAFLNGRGWIYACDDCCAHGSPALARRAA